MDRVLRLLVDTNVVIPLEPLATRSVEASSKTAMDLARRAQESGALVLLHPAQRDDIERDRDESRRDLRRLQLQRYPKLEAPPPIPRRMIELLGDPPTHSNDAVDHALLAAVLQNAVHLLVTEDSALLSKARRLGIERRVLRIGEALALFPDATQARELPGAARRTFAHEVSLDDPILASLRADYAPGFDSWWEKCQRERRVAFTIAGDADGIAALAVLHPEPSPPAGLAGRVLKICTFKVAERFSGYRMGELLLKSVLNEAQDADHDHCFVTVLPKHARLIELFEDYGFEDRGAWNESGERWLARPLRPEALGQTAIAALEPLPYHVRLGPRHLRHDVPWHLVPIQPKYSDVLFPESAIQGSVFRGRHPYGNAMRKAYLCHAPIRSLTPGSALAFYRSTRRRGLIAVGVLEEARALESAESVVEFVARRTVYSLAEIRDLARKPVLALLFRHAWSFKPEIKVGELTAAGLFARPPQSIMRLGAEGGRWISGQAGRSRSSR